MDRFTDIKNYKKTIRELRKLYKNKNTQKTWIVKIINEIKEMPSSQANVINLTRYREELENLQLDYVNEKMTKQPTEKEKENYLSLEELRNVWLEEYKDSYEFFILGLYIWLPARRTDYVNLKLRRLDDGSYIFHLPSQIKVNQEKSIDIEIPEQLEKMMYEDYVVQLRKTSNNALVKQIKRYSKQVFGKELTINLYRKIWVDYVKKNGNDLDSRIELSNQMNHSIFTSKDLYERVF